TGGGAAAPPRGLRPSAGERVAGDDGTAPGQGDALSSRPPRRGDHRRGDRRTPVDRLRSGGEPSLGAAGAAGPDLRRPATAGDRRDRGPRGAAVSFFQNLHIFVGNLSWRDLVDMLVVAFLLYQLLKLIRGTQAAQLLVGLVVLVLVGVVANIVHLRLINFIFTNGGQALAIAAVVLFQPELRRALDQMGRLSPVRAFFGHHEGLGVNRLIEEVLRAAASLSERRTGALLVFERGTGLENVATTGVRVNGEV